MRQRDIATITTRTFAAVRRIRHSATRPLPDRRLQENSDERAELLSVAVAVSVLSCAAKQSHISRKHAARQMFDAGIAFAGRRRVRGGLESLAGRPTPSPRRPMPERTFTSYLVRCDFSTDGPNRNRRPNDISSFRRWRTFCSAPLAPRHRARSSAPSAGGSSAEPSVVI